MNVTISKNKIKEQEYKIIRYHPLLNLILKKWKSDLGDNYELCNNHSLRVINYVFYQMKPNEEMKQKIVFAAAFHQLSLFINHKSNYNNYHIHSAELFESSFNCFDFYHSDSVLNAVLKHSVNEPVFYNNDCFESCFWNAYMIDSSLLHRQNKIPKDFIESVKKCLCPNEYYKFIFSKKIKSFVF